MVTLETRRMNPRIVESFLLSLDGVLDASAWISRGKLLAHVTVSEDAPLGEADVRSACERAISPEAVPALILFQRAARPRARRAA